MVLHIHRPYDYHLYGSHSFGLRKGTQLGIYIYVTYLIYIFVINLKIFYLQRYQLIRYVYEYLKLIQDKKPQRWVMEEYWKIKQMDYDSLEMDLNQLEFAKLLSGLHFLSLYVIIQFSFW